MNLAVKTSDERINDILLGPLERPVLRWLCERMPPWVTPDILTAIGLLGGVITAAAYWLCIIDRNFLWLSDIGLAVNWFGDSLDGNIARYRRSERFQYGYFIDHTVDTLTQTLICVGLGLSHYIRFQYALLVLVGYLQLGILTYVDTAVTGTFKISYGKIGPTEIRFIIVAVNLIFYFVPNPTLRLPFLQIALFDVIALFFCGSILYLLYRFYAHPCSGAGSSRSPHSKSVDFVTMSDGITQALLITVHAPYATVYGGEILLNRALIALSKSGIRSATIVCQAGQREQITSLIRLITHRLQLHFDIVEKRTDESLAHVLMRATEQWHEVFFSVYCRHHCPPDFFYPGTPVSCVAKAGVICLQRRTHTKRTRCVRARVCR
jgi:phosphatidylglycerophosphate synthase